MNSDICPPGTWSWLESLGYSKADVMRITKQRRLRRPTFDDLIKGYPNFLAPPIMDAEPMTASEIAYRRREALKLRFPLMRGECDRITG